MSYAWFLLDERCGVSEYAFVCSYCNIKSRDHQEDGRGV